MRTETNKPSAISRLLSPSAANVATSRSRSVSCDRAGCGLSGWNVGPFAVAEQALGPGLGLGAATSKAGLPADPGLEHRRLGGEEVGPDALELVCRRAGQIDVTAVGGEREGGASEHESPVDLVTHFRQSLRDECGRTHAGQVEERRGRGGVLSPRFGQRHCLEEQLAPPVTARRARRRSRPGRG